MQDLDSSIVHRNLDAKIKIGGLEALDLLLDFADGDFESLGVFVGDGQLEVEDGVLVDLLDFLVFLLVVVFNVSH